MNLPTPMLPFLALFGLMYAAFGVASPFLPSLLEARGIAPEQIGLLFALGTAIRLIAAPLAGRLADRSQALRLVLATFVWLAALSALGYLPAVGFAQLLAVSLVHAFALAPVTNLADAMALLAARRPDRGFEYGWARGTGSAAFIVGSLVAGALIPIFGLSVSIVLQAALLLIVPFTLLRVQSAPIGLGEQEQKVSRDDIITLLRLPTFRRVVLVAALILGSHALHDTFSAMRWMGSGVSPPMVSALWSLSVVGEVMVFFLLGPLLLNALTPAGAIALASLAAAARWVVAAFTVDPIVLAILQPMHGLTFALLHLACMRLLMVSIPASLAATAQAIYGTVGVGSATAIMNLASGWLYARWSGHAFLVMSVVSLVALPVAFSLSNAQSDPKGRTTSQ